MVLLLEGAGPRRGCIALSRRLGTLASPCKLSWNYTPPLGGGSAPTPDSVWRAAFAAAISRAYRSSGDALSAGRLRSRLTSQCHSFMIASAL